MCKYEEKDLLRLAKRFHNTKRTYLLVNPLQGKHIPCSPSATLKMLRTLGRKFAEEAPDVGFVIGFAETATAVGAAVANSLCHPCVYVQTTREKFSITDDRVFFEEEHSHATSQFICLGEKRSALGQAKEIAFVDDEISTGKTLLNSIEALRKIYPELEGKRIWAVSVINRLNDEQTEEFRKRNIWCCCLKHLPMRDYTSAVEKYVIHEATAPQPASLPVEWINLPPVTADARHGAPIADYHQQCEAQASAILKQIRTTVEGKKITVIGTEENMYPGLILGEMIEKIGICPAVLFHATTRSPIGLCDTDDYPITSGYRLGSFYETDRMTYIYNLKPAEVAVIVTDSPDTETVKKALTDLSSALAHSGYKKIIIAQEARHVRNL